MVPNRATHHISNKEEEKLKFCSLMNDSNNMQHEIKNIKFAMTEVVDCQCKGVAYFATSKKHSKVYIGKTTETHSKRISKLKYENLK